MKENNPVKKKHYPGPNYFIIIALT